MESHLLSSVSDLNAWQKNPGNRAVATGSLCMHSLTKLDSSMEQGFVRLKERQTSFFGKKQPIYCTVDERVLETKNVVLDIDCYLGWGIQKPGSNMILSCHLFDDKTMVTIYVFKDRKLIQIKEFGLVNHTQYKAEFEEKLASKMLELSSEHFKNNGDQINYYFAPTIEFDEHLSNLQQEFSNRIKCSVNSLPMSVYRWPLARPVMQGKNKGILVANLVPAALIILAIIVYGIPVTYSWTNFQKSVEAFTNGSVHSSQKESLFPLDVLEQIKYLADQPQTEFSNQIIRSAKAIAEVKGVIIKRINLDSENSFKTTIAVPKSEDSLIAQGKFLATQLASLLGVEINLTFYTDLNDARSNLALREYTFEAVYFDGEIDDPIQ